MNFLKTLALGLGALMISAPAMAETGVIPMGTIKYDPAKCWNSYVMLSPAVSGASAKLIDRNGNLVKEWDLKGSNGMPNKLYPGGHLLTSIYPTLKAGWQDMNTVALLDFDGKVLRTFSKGQQIPNGEGDQPKEADGNYWSARQHHDYQIEGSSTGYYTPGIEKNIKLDGKMLVLAHRNTKNARINPHQLVDDVIYVVDSKGEVAWEWHASDHFAEFGFTDAAKQKIASFKPHGDVDTLGGVDWLHMNCASWLGPNQWYDAGDQRFHPENIICDSRNSSHLFIIDHKTGEIVWQVAPPFVGEDGALGPIAGVHGTHMIPKGLPGEGNILLFDNGGTMPGDVYPSQAHAWSRVIEFNPVTKSRVWEYSAPVMKVLGGTHGFQFFFSPYISIAQRLPNGNTLIDEGATSRVFEVTPMGEIVWEYRSPYSRAKAEGHNVNGGVNYRAYAVPYEWVPQLKKPVEVPVSFPQYPDGFIVLPDDKGNLPNMKPTIDKLPNVQFGEPWVVTRPAK